MCHSFGLNSFPRKTTSANDQHFALILLQEMRARCSRPMYKWPRHRRGKPFKMSLCRVPEELMVLLKQVSSTLSLPKVSHSSIRPSSHGCSAEFTLCLAHPEWKEWLEKIQQVAQSILQRDASRILQIESCVHEASSYLHLAVDRGYSVPKILSLCRSDYSPQAVSKADAITSVDEILTIVTFKPPNQSWNSLRLKLYSTVTTHMVTHWPNKYTSCNTMEIIDDEAQWAKEIPCESIATEFAALSGQTEFQNDDQCLVAISSNCSIEPPLTNWQFNLKNGSSLLYLMTLLKSKFKVAPPHYLLIFVMSKSLVKVQKALALCNLAGFKIRIVPIESVSCDDSMEVYSNHLKNMLIAQAIEENGDGPGSDENEDGNGKGERNGKGEDKCGDGKEFSLPSVDSGKVLSLFNTCMRCNLLSVKSSSQLILKHEKNRNYLFVQYNIARIESILSQYFKQVPRIDFAEIDLSSLTSDHEWSLILNYILPFFKFKQGHLEDDIIALTPDKLIQFTVNLAKDVGSYYSKTRILKDNWQTCPVIMAKIYLLQSIQRILVDIMKAIGVEAVLKMWSTCPTCSGWSSIVILPHLIPSKKSIVLLACSLRHFDL